MDQQRHCQNGPGCDISQTVLLSEPMSFGACEKRENDRRARSTSYVFSHQKLIQHATLAKETNLLTFVSNMKVNCKSLKSLTDNPVKKCFDILLVGSEIFSESWERNHGQRRVPTPGQTLPLKGLTVSSDGHNDTNAHFAHGS